MICFSLSGILTSLRPLFKTFHHCSPSGSAPYHGSAQTPTYHHSYLRWPCAPCQCRGVCHSDTYPCTRCLHGRSCNPASKHLEHTSMPEPLSGSVGPKKMKSSLVSPYDTTFTGGSSHPSWCP